VVNYDQIERTLKDRTRVNDIVPAASAEHKHHKT